MSCHLTTIGIGHCGAIWPLGISCPLSDELRPTSRAYQLLLLLLTANVRDPDQAGRTRGIEIGRNCCRRHDGLSPSGFQHDGPA